MHKDVEQRRVRQRRKLFEGMAAAGLSPTETARAAGVHRRKVYEYRRRFGIVFQCRQRVMLERECQILAARLQGATIAEIARRHGLSDTRISHILRRNGVGPTGVWATRRDPFRGT